jgi:hypothetical protein
VPYAYQVFGRGNRGRANSLALIGAQLEQASAVEESFSYSAVEHTRARSLFQGFRLYLVHAAIRHLAEKVVTKLSFLICILGVTLQRLCSSLRTFKDYADYSPMIYDAEFFAT